MAAVRRKPNTYDTTASTEYFAPGYIPYEDGGVTGGQQGEGGYSGTGQEFPRNPDTAPPPADPAPPAFDPYQQVGHNGTINGMNREQWRDAWQSSGISNIADMKNWMSQHGGKVLADNGMTLTPFGETMDILQGAKTGHGTPSWGGSESGSSEPIPLSPGGGGGQVPSFGGGGGGGGGFHGDIHAELAKLFPDGAFNKNALNARVSNLSDILNRNRKSQMATNSAFLADRGQSKNDGTFGTSAGNLETRLNENFNAGVNDAFAHESDLADQRMIQALSLATGLTADEAKNAVDMARINSDSSLGWGNIALGNKNADINRELGQGNIGLGYYRAGNDYDLGLGNLGLGRDTLNSNIHNASIDQLLNLFGIYFGGSGQANNGYVGK
jgi:hypothetical protein